MARVLEPEVMDAAGEALAYDELERVVDGNAAELFGW